MYFLPDDSFEKIVYLCITTILFSLKNLILFSLLFILGCTSSTKQIDALFEKKSAPIENGNNIKMIYSDSADVVLLLESPVFISKTKGNKKIIEYPEGIKISFLDSEDKPNSWLIADKAENLVKDKKFIVRENVKLYNSNNDKLETSELIWDEKKEILSTEKFVKITQPSKGDTLYGYGFVSNREFTEFEIKKKLFGKIVEDIFKDIK